MALTTTQSNAATIGGNVASVIAGWLLSRLLKRAWIDASEYNTLIAILPMGLLNAWIFIRTRSKLWNRIKLVANMDRTVTLEELHALEAMVKAGYKEVPAMPRADQPIEIVRLGPPPPPPPDKSLSNPGGIL